MSRIVARADVDVSIGLENAFRQRGIAVITSAAVHELQTLSPGVRVLYRVDDGARSLDVDAVFFAVGWPGNADLIDCAAAGVATDRGYVTVDAFTSTNVPHIFAAGDVAGNSMLVSSGPTSSAATRPISTPVSTSNMPCLRINRTTLV